MKYFFQIGKNLLFVSFILFFCNQLKAQKRIADSLNFRLSQEKKDSSKVKLMWQIARACSKYNPDTAIVIAKNAVFLARKIKYEEGESWSLGTLANTFLVIPNYPRALESYLQQLKIEEKRNNPKNLAMVTMNIGVVYTYQEEYSKALLYYYKADSLIYKNKIDEFKFNTAVNIGDLYNRIDIQDSAFIYFTRALNLAQKQKNNDFIGGAMIGLGHVFLKKQNFNQALLNYKGALEYLSLANDEFNICEAALGLARLYDSLANRDSAYHYAHLAFYLSKKDSFQNWQLESANFLARYYKKIHKSDSAVEYMMIVQQLSDSINSNYKVREVQVLFSNEQIRQIELAEAQRKAREERGQQLQMLFIGLLIPMIFLVTLLLSRKKIHFRVVKFMGVLSMLILFEYLTLWMHPNVAEWTHHTPLIEILIFVCLAAILIPAHHRLEHWLLEKLTHSKHRLEQGQINIHRQKLKLKKPSD